MSYKILDERDIDLKYSSNSENAQSGKAVAEAIANVGGNPEVYVGSGDMPEGYVLKIDPNGDEVFEVEQTYNPESENPQSGKAVAEALATVGGEYELVETITVAEEGITSITRNTESNGKAYNFKDVFINFKWSGSAPQKWVLLEITTNGKKYNAFRTLAGTNGGYSWVRTICCYGHRLFLFSERTTNLGFTAFTAEVPYMYANTNKPITSLMIQHETAIPLNTTIEIWGVRV